MNRLVVKSVFFFFLLFSVGSEMIFSALGQGQNNASRDIESVDFQFHTTQYSSLLPHSPHLKSEVSNWNLTDQAWESESEEEEKKSFLREFKSLYSGAFLAALFKAIVWCHSEYFSTKISHYCDGENPPFGPRLHLVNQTFLI